MISLSGEKKKTKSIDSELNPVWNEVNPLHKHTQTSFTFRSAAKAGIID